MNSEPQLGKAKEFCILNSLNCYPTENEWQSPTILLGIYVNIFDRKVKLIVVAELFVSVFVHEQLIAFKMFSCQ